MFTTINIVIWVLHFSSFASSGIAEQQVFYSYKALYVGLGELIFLVFGLTRQLGIRIGLKYFSGFDEETLLHGIIS